MSKSVHPTYSAADRYERRMSRRQRPTVRRVTSRHAQRVAAITEEV